MRKILLMLFITLFMVTTFAMAIPPVQISEQAGELQIVYPKFDSYPYQELYPHFHVYNSTGFLVTDADCIFHVYNNSGNHVYEGNLTLDSNGIDYKGDLIGSMFTLNDYYTYLVSCNNSYEGGFVSGGFQVTQKGEMSVPQNQGLFLIPIGFFLLIIIFLMIYQNTSEEHIFIKTLIIFLIPALLIGTTGYILSLTSSFVGSKIALWFYKFTNIFSYIFIFYFTIALFISLIKYFKKLKNG